MSRSVHRAYRFQRGNHGKSAGDHLQHDGLRWRGRRVPHPRSRLLRAGLAGPVRHVHQGRTARMGRIRSHLQLHRPPEGGRPAEVVGMVPADDHRPLRRLPGLLRRLHHRGQRRVEELRTRHRLHRWTGDPLRLGGLLLHPVARSEPVPGAGGRDGWRATAAATPRRAATPRNRAIRPPGGYPPPTARHRPRLRPCPPIPRHRPGTHLPHRPGRCPRPSSRRERGGLVRSAVALGTGPCRALGHGGQGLEDGLGQRPGRAGSSSTATRAPAPRDGFSRSMFKVWSAGAWTGWSK